MNAIPQGASAPLVFQSTTFEVVDRNGQPWLRVNQIGLALQYKRPDLSIGKLYRANAAEFTDSMTALVKLPTAGGEQETRIFSLRGAHLLGMFARTKAAADFRRWVLDILDRETATAAPAPAAPVLPVPDPITRNLRARIHKQAHALSLAQYDTLQDLLEELVTSNLRCGATEGACEDYLNRFGSHMGGVTLVNTHDLYQLSRTTTNLLDEAGKALAVIHRLEKHTGLALYQRESVAGLPDSLCKTVFEALKDC